MNFQKGEVHLVNLEPTKGAEIQKTRPAVIVSNNVISNASAMVIVCPITDSTGKKSPIHVLVPEKEGGLVKESVVHCGQIRAIDKLRLFQELGHLSADTMRQVETGIKYVLF